jgi:hypothetical protein
LVRKIDWIVLGEICYADVGENGLSNECGDDL